MSADATTTPSAARRRPRAWSGVEMPKPMITGRSVTALSRLASTVDDVGQRGPLAGDAEQVHAVDEAPGPLAERGSRSSGVSGEASSTVSSPAVGGGGSHSPSSSIGRSGRITPRHAGRHRLGGEALVARVEHEVEVGHDHERDAGVDVAQLRRGSRSRLAPWRQRHLRRLLDRGAVHHRVGERDADLDGVGAGVGEGPDAPRASRRRARR